MPPVRAKDPSAPQRSAGQNRWPAETLVAERPGAHKSAGRMSTATARLKIADKARAEAEAERSRGQMRFGSVEDATTLLEQHCDQIQMPLLPPRAHPKARQYRQLPLQKQQAETSYQSIFGPEPPELVACPSPRHAFGYAQCSAQHRSCAFATGSDNRSGCLVPARLGHGSGRRTGADALKGSVLPRQSPPGGMRFRRSGANSCTVSAHHALLA